MCHECCPAPVSGGAGIVEGRVETPGAGRAVPGFLARPEGDAPAPGVIILHDIWGANDFYHDLARRLAGEGFAALLPDLFVREGPLPQPTREAAFARRARQDQTVALADTAGAIGWLRDHPATTGKVGVVGFCLGDTFVMLAAAREPLPDAGVAFYGFPVFETTPNRPVCPMEEADRVRAPLLLLWGDQDQGVGVDNMRAYDRALTAAGARRETIIYPGPGHAFLTFDPAAPHHAEAQDAWARALAFFRGELGA